MRIFIALCPPTILAQQLALLGGGIPRARWDAAEKLHITLRFCGDICGQPYAELLERLAKIRASAFELQLASVGHFPPRGQPRSLWVGARATPQLFELKSAIDAAADAVGLDPDPRNFVPHLTLARLRNAPTDKVAAFLAHHSLYEAPLWSVEEFVVMRSILSPGGSKYDVVERFALEPVDPPGEA